MKSAMRRATNNRGCTTTIVPAMDPIKKQFEEYIDEATAAIKAAVSSEALEEVRVKFLGAKKGRLRERQALLGKADKELRPLLGKEFNKTKAIVTDLYEKGKAKLSAPKTAVADLDITLPGARPRLGNRHPLTQTIEEFKEIMGRFGFTVASGPETED